jgi:hypothetical protein
MKNPPQRRVATHSSETERTVDTDTDTDTDFAQGVQPALSPNVEPSAPSPAEPRESTGVPASAPPGGPLAFRDFIPRQLSGVGVFKVAEYESFDAAVVAANHWIVEHAIEVIQLETVVLPNIWSKYEEGTLDASIGTSGGMTAHWHQFLRVWHRVGVTE